MISSESDQIWSTYLATGLERKMMLQISEAFAKEHNDARAIPKHVSKKTGISPDTIKKWKNGLNPPRLRHFSLVLKHYPDARQFLLDLVIHNMASKGDKIVLKIPRTDLVLQDTACAKFYGAKYCTISLSLPIRIAIELNQRQLWFLGLLQQGEHRKADYISATWQVSLRMAKYDVEDLIKQSLIRFKGAKKNGWYEVV